MRFSNNLLHFYLGPHLQGFLFICYYYDWKRSWGYIQSDERMMSSKNDIPTFASKESGWGRLVGCRDQILENLEHQSLFYRMCCFFGICVPIVMLPKTLLAIFAGRRLEHDACFRIAVIGFSRRWASMFIYVRNISFWAILSFYSSS